MVAGPLPGADETVRPSPGEGDGKADPGLVALLSLQLLLLAFFILLTALSRFEQDRVHRVVESVTDSFGVPFVASAPQPAAHGSLGFHEAMKPIVEELRRVAAATLPVELEIELRRDGELRIEIPDDLLFGAADATPRATVRPLLTAVARALNGPRFEARPWALDASARAVPLPGRDRAGAQELAVRRAAATARSLAALGLERARLAAGLLDDGRRSLRLTVRPLPAGAQP